MLIHAAKNGGVLISHHYTTHIVAVAVDCAGFVSVVPPLSMFSLQHRRHIKRQELHSNQL